MSDPTTDPSDALDELRRAYARSLPDKARTCREALTGWRSAASPESAATLWSVAHRLVGSGTTHGQPAVTEAARAILEALGAPADAGREARLEAAVAALERAASAAAGGEV